MRFRLHAAMLATMLAMTALPPPAHANTDSYLGGDCDMVIASFPGHHSTLCTGRAVGWGAGVSPDWGDTSWTADGANLVFDFSYGYDDCLAGQSWGTLTVHPVTVTTSRYGTDANARLLGYFEMRRVSEYAEIYYYALYLQTSFGTESGWGFGRVLWHPVDVVHYAGRCSIASRGPLAVHIFGGGPDESELAVFGG